jgi:thymidylate synthase (FAD)
MRLIKPSVEIWDQEEGLNGVYKSIERAGRICYKSSDKITDDSAEPFVDRMIKSLHHSMLEQGTVYLTIPREDTNYHIYLSKYRDNPYSECRVAQTLEGIPVGSLYISTNYRVIIEHDWTDDLKYLCKPTKFHEKRISVHFTLDRAVSMEFLRHRKCSFAQESTRYCDYSKNKFNNEITYIIPIWLDVPETEYGTLLTPKDIQFKEYTNLSEKEFINHLLDSEYRYFNLLKLGWTPQQARQVLPNALKTELVMTGFISDWKHFIDLRYRGTTGKPHPDAFYLAEKLYNLFKEKGIEI